MFDRLPPEIITEICTTLTAQGQSRSLASLAQTCQAAHAACISILYRRLVLTRANADALFRGLPRTAYAFICPPYAEYAAQLEAFQDNLAGQTADDDEFEMHPDFEWDELPHPTDGEYLEDHEVALSNAASWARRRELLSLCTELVVVQWPRIGVVCDLIKATDPTFEYPDADEDNESQEEDEEEEGEDDEEDGDADDADDKPASDKAAENKSPTPDVHCPTGRIFPNLERLCLSRQAVRTMADYEESHNNLLNGDAYDYGDHIDRYIPYGQLLSTALGSAKHICMSRPPSPYDNDDDEGAKAKYIFDLYRRTVDNIFDNHFEYTTGGRETRVTDLSARLPASVDSLTIHGLRGRDSIGCSQQSATRYRLFYDPACTADTVESRTRALLASAKSVHSVVQVGPLEVIGVDCGITGGTVNAAETIRTFVEDAIAADPTQYGECIPPPTFIPTQHAPEAAAALAALEAELAALGPDLPTKGTYRAHGAHVRAKRQLDADRGTPREDAARAELAAAEADVAQAAKAKEAKDVKDAVKCKVACAQQELWRLREEYEQYTYRLHLPRIVWRTDAEAEPCVVCGTKAGPVEAEW